MDKVELRAYLTADAVKYLFESVDNPDNLRVFLENSAKNYLRKLDDQFAKNGMVERLAERCFTELEDKLFIGGTRRPTDFFRQALGKVMHDLFAQDIAESRQRLLNSCDDQIEQLTKRIKTSLTDTAIERLVENAAEKYVAKAMEKAVKGEKA
jgi:hypothetical protein